MTEENPFYRKSNKIDPFFLVIITIIALFFIGYFLTIIINNQESSFHAKKDVRKAENRTPKIKEQVNSKTKSNESPIEDFEQTKKVEKVKKKKDAGFKTTPEKEKNIQAQKAYRSLISGNFSKALFYYKKIKKPNNGILFFMGVCHYKLGEYNKAYDILKDVVKNDNGNYSAKRFLAYTCYKLNKINESLKYTRDVIQKFDDYEIKAFRNKLIKEQNVMKDYDDLSTTSFKILFSHYEHVGIQRTVLNLLREANREIGVKTNYYPPQQIIVILYNNKDFKDITRAPSWAGGLYDGKIRIPIKNLQDNTKLLKRIIFHEYTHAYVHSITRKCPLWVNEGLAEYFSNSGVKKIGQVISLKKLEQTFPSGNKTAIVAAYRVSYSAVSYLINRYRMSSMMEFLNYMGKNISFREAFRKAFYISYNEFVSSWGK